MNIFYRVDLNDISPHMYKSKEHNEEVPVRVLYGYGPAAFFNAISMFYFFDDSRRLLTTPSFLPTIMYHKRPASSACPHILVYHILSSIIISTTINLYDLIGQRNSN